MGQWGGEKWREKESRYTYEVQVNIAFGENEKCVIGIARPNGRRRIWARISLL